MTSTAGSTSWLLAATAAVVAATGVCYHLSKKSTTTTSTPPANPSHLSTAADAVVPTTETTETTPSYESIRVAYGTQTGTAKRLAGLLQDHRPSNILDLTTSLVDMKTYDVDNLEKEQVIVFIMCTWEGGVPPESATIFCNWLEDMAQDFRVPNTFLANTSYAVFGLGSSEYEPMDRFCKAALRLDEHMERLGAKRLTPVVKGDASKDIEVQFVQWSHTKLWPALRRHRNGAAAEDVERTVPSEHTASAATAAATTATATTEPLKWESLADDTDGLLRPVVRDVKDHVPLAEYRRNNRKAKRAARLKARAADLVENDEDRLNASLVDLEDLGSAMKEGKQTVSEEIAAKPSERPEMVTPMQRKALTKEGYSIIGTHSAVKLCRWTKHQLRGRGGCYKHTCYGIVSYMCMEATPSLACANKCVFCWRHHKNPVGTKWRWKQDPPEKIVSEAIVRHCKMIHTAKGVPGVKMDRWMAAVRGPKHCALSLVGEPIMYPEINQLLTLLDSQGISTFLTGLS